MQLRDVTDADLAAVLALNEDSVPHVSSIEHAQMRWFAENASYFRVVIENDRLAGFLIGLRPGLDYPSENYRWFCDNYEEFAYVDRVAVDKSARRLGVASMLYEDFGNQFRNEVPRMTCEVNIRPANEGSMRYHILRGFVQVATQKTEGGKKEVALMEMRF